MRGQIVARVTVISSAVLSITTLLASVFLDSHPGLYALIYLFGAAAGLSGARTFSQVHVRGEAQALREAAKLPSTGSGMLLVKRVARDTVLLLRNDKRFRIYQRWQMVQGFSFMMMLPALYIMVNQELTDPKSDYAVATTVVHVIPYLLSTLFIQLWAPLFDRISFPKFRVLQSMSATLTHTMILVGAMSENLWVVSLGTAFLGVSMAGGTLAWNLGQNSFAPPERLGQYMGVHITLTGLRGMVAPFVGWGLYSLPSVGHNVFFITTALCTCAMVGYIFMERDSSSHAAKQSVAHDTGDQVMRAINADKIS